MPMLLSCRNLAKSFAARTLFTGVSLVVEDADRLGLIGPNGSGKSTLIKILAGLEHADSGLITLAKGLRVGYVAQRDDFPDGATALSVVKGALTAAPGLAHDDHEAELKAEMTLQRVGFTDLDTPAAALSGGWRKRLAIARELAGEPGLVLMDEPTNHLDLEGILWLEDLLRRPPYPLAAVFVSHDRSFLDRAATRVVELSSAYPDGTFAAEGSYDTFLERRDSFLEAQAKEEQALAGQVRRDAAWLARGAKARRTKSKSRIQASHGRMDRLADLQARNAPTRAAGIEFSATGRRTQRLLVGQNLGLALAPHTPAETGTAPGQDKEATGRPLFSGVDLLLTPGMVLGLLGPNGSGKTSLIRLLTGEPGPQDRALGTIKRAEGLRTVLFTQHREELDPTITLKEAICPVSDQFFFNGQAVHVNGWARRFLFTPDQLRTPVGTLSGGEQARVLLARLMTRPADLLILDEPTNDLDIPSLEVLEEALEEFPGAVVLVTHDRSMIERLSTDILALDGRGGSKMYADYAQWETARRAELAAAAKAAADARPAPAAPPEPAARPSSKKLTYNEQREWGAMEESVLAAERRVAVLEARTADPALAADHAVLHAAFDDLHEAQAEVSALYTRWAELEAKQK